MDMIARGASGVAGGACCSTIEQGLSRLATSFATMSPGVNLDAARQSIVSSFDLALEVCTPSDGRDRVRRVAELVCSASGITLLIDVYSFVPVR
jgi:hypothetical protein